MARAATPHGEVALRRRGPVLELVVDGAFAMDTVDTSSEVALARAALRRHRRPARVLVGGLGLGFTTRAVLADPRVGHVDVVELAAPLVGWARSALVPELSGIEGERCALVVGDVADALSGRCGAARAVGRRPARRRQRPRLPRARLERGPLRRLRTRAARGALATGGVLVVWSSSRAPELLVALREVAEDGDAVEEEVLRVEREGRLLEYALYSLTRSTTGLRG